jgi:glucose-6-phosphate dehydrogenase assembly protein OpcA
MAQRLTAVRAASVTVLVLAQTEAEAAAAAEMLRALDARWPVQASVVAVGDARPPGRLRSRVRRLRYADLPVVLWRPAGLPAVDDPELDWVDHVVIDSRSGVSIDDLSRSLLDIARRVPVTDLAWLELAPWRELLAGLFEGPAYAPFLSDVRRVRVEGDAIRGRLLAGWLLRRLGLSDRVGEVAAADRMAIEIQAEHAGRLGRFSVAWSADRAIIEAEAQVVGDPSQRRRWPPGERGDVWLLGRALARLEADHLYIEALS